MLQWHLRWILTLHACVLLPRQHPWGRQIWRCILCGKYRREAIMIVITWMDWSSWKGQWKNIGIIHDCILMLGMMIMSIYPLLKDFVLTTAPSLSLKQTKQYIDILLFHFYEQIPPHFQSSLGAKSPSPTNKELMWSAVARTLHDHPCTTCTCLDVLQ